MMHSHKTLPGKAGRRTLKAKAHKRIFAYSALSITLVLALAGFAGSHWLTTLEPEQSNLETHSPTHRELAAQPTAGRASEPVIIVPLNTNNTHLSATKSVNEDTSIVEVEHPNEVDFDLDAIAAVLSELNIDDEGQLVKDDNLRQALQTAFLSSAKPMTVAELEDLKTLVRAGLGGSAGSQAADIAERYYHYSDAYREVSSTFQHQSAVSSVESNAKQLSIMRRAYLGDDLASALFGEEEAQMHYTLESMQIQSDDTLSAKEKAARHEALKSSAPEAFVSKNALEKPAPESTL